MSQKYELKVINKSSNPGDICVYQTREDTTVNGIMSLAWFQEYAYPTTTVVFDWSLDYQFMWDETGILVPGVVFEASQIWDADLETKNMVSLHYDRAYNFKNVTMNPQSAGSLVIKQDYSIPLNEGCVGIGMSGAGTFAFPAQPNTTLVFTPKPSYWVTFGSFTKGQVLDTTQITNQAHVAFAPNVYAMTAVLNLDNTWTIGPSGTV